MTKFTMSFILVSSVSSEAWSTPEVEHVGTCGQSQVQAHGSTSKYEFFLLKDSYLNSDLLNYKLIRKCIEFKF